MKAGNAKSAIDTKFISALKRLVTSWFTANITDGIIEAVNETNYTADVKCIDATFYNVPLRVLVGHQAGFIEIPKVGTNCTIAFRDANLNRPTMLEVHEVQKVLIKCDNIIFNDGNLGGMVKVGKLVEAYNNVVTDMNIIKAALATPCVNGVALNPTFTPATTTKSNTFFENSKIKQ
jgi:hypothetical protein